MQAARGPTRDAWSHNRVVRGAARERCAISLIRRGYRAYDEGSAEMQDGGNAGTVAFGLLANKAEASSGLTPGDAAILRFPDCARNP